MMKKIKKQVLACRLDPLVVDYVVSQADDKTV